MAYRPPTSSKYGAPIPVAGISIGSKPQPAFPGKSAPVTKSEDWTAFGGKKKHTLPEVPKPVKEVEIDLNAGRNTLSNYVNLVTKDLPPIPSKNENKWGQSAIKRKPVTPPPEKTFEEQFPSLGGGTVIPKNTSSGNLSKSSSSGSLSMAERMKQKLIEEEEERKRKQAEEEERKKKEEEERISLTGGVGIFLNVSRNFTMREFEDTTEEENYNTLDYDVYGGAVNDSQDYNYENHEYEEEEDDEEEFQEVR